jgi:hypothetical protein
MIKACQKELSNRDKSYVTPLKEVMIKFCEDKDLAYYYNGAEAGNAKLLLTKLKYVIQQKNGQLTDDIMLKSISIFIQAAYDLNDEWIRSRFTIRTLNNQFERIVNATRESNNKSKSINERFTGSPSGDTNTNT